MWPLTRRQVVVSVTVGIRSDRDRSHQALIDERIDQLLAEVDPSTTDPVEFRGRQYDLGLAWVHFPEGWGGLGLAPDAPARGRPPALRAAGATSPDARHFFGLTMAGPTVVTHGNDELRDAAAAPDVHRRGGVVPAVQRARRRLRPRRPGVPRRSATATSGSSPARRCGTRWPTSPTAGMLVARTDPEAPKHKGMTYFALDMHAAGRRGAAAAPDDRRGRVQRGVPDRGAGARRRPHRRRRRGLAGGHDDADERAHDDRRRRCGGRRPRARAPSPRPCASGRRRPSDARRRRTRPR